MNEEKQESRLVPEMIPKALFRRSVYRTVKRSVWDNEIRARVIEEANQTCAYCGARYEKGMFCHEEWKYMDKTHVARLVGFKLVCRDCSNAIHYGKSSTLGIQGKVEEHLAKVNDISMDEVKKLVREAVDVWIIRSGIQDWRIEIDEALIEDYPVLADVEIV